MLEKTNKMLIILVAILIILLIVAIIMFSEVLKRTSNKAEENINPLVASEGREENSINTIDIADIPEKNEVLVAVLDGDKKAEEDGLIVIGTDSQTNNKVDNNMAPYYIKVNVQANTITIYKKDGAGNYSIPLKAMICSCGGATPVEGTYSLKKYNHWDWKTLYGRTYGRYATQISGDILFHSVPYAIKGDNASLRFSEYDKLGSIATTGSVQLTVEDSKWIYDNCIPGTQITFYTEENPGPLGKPTPKLITEDEDVRGWDPTDPAENNPWRNYVRPEKKKEENNQIDQNTINQNTIDNNTINQNTLMNNVMTNTFDRNTIENNLENNTNTSNNTVNNRTTNTTVRPENRILEQNDDITITSEVIETNSL